MRVETLPSGRRDSNSRPSPWQGDALPTEPRPHAPCSLTLWGRRSRGVENSSGLLSRSTNRGVERPVAGVRRRLSETCTAPATHASRSPEPRPAAPVTGVPGTRHQRARNLPPTCPGSRRRTLRRPPMCKLRRAALRLLLARAIGAVVARFVHTEEVTGSNPVSPTRVTGRLPQGGGPFSLRAFALQAFALQAFPCRRLVGRNPTAGRPPETLTPWHHRRVSSFPADPSPRKSPVPCSPDLSS